MATSLIGENNSSGGRNPFITKDQLSPGLLGDMEKMAIDRGTAFFSNKATSLFMKKDAAGDSLLDKASGAAALAGQTVGGAINVGATVLNSGLQAVDNAQMMIDFSAKCIETVEGEAAKIVGLYAGKLTTLTMQIPVKIGQRTAYWTKVYSAEYMKQALAEMSKDKEDVLEKLEKELEKEDEDKAKKSVTETLSKMQEKVKEAMEKVQKPINDISSYMAEGPQWVINKANKYIEDAVDTVDVFCEEKYNIAEEWVDNFTDKTGEKAGKKIAKKAADKAVDKLQKALNKKEEVESKAKKKANMATKKALLKIKGLMGM